MVKKVFNWMLMAALVVGFSMSFNACSDDDDDKESESEKITKIANQVWAYSVEHPDGFTLDIKTMKEPTEGIAVAYAATQGSHSRQSLDKVVGHALKNGGYVGGWLDTSDGLYYFDSVRLFPEDQLEAARQFAIENEQLAFFIISTGTEIRLDGESRIFRSATARTYAPTWYTTTQLQRLQFKVVKE